MKGTIHWTTDRTLDVGGFSIPVARGLKVAFSPDAGCSQDMAGVRPETPRRLLLKRVAWPFAQLKDSVFFLGHSFLHRLFARELAKHQTDRTVFLEIGCGDMTLRDAIRPDLAYNAVDFAFSQFQLTRVRSDPRVNVCLASVTDLPVPDGAVTLMTSTEVLHQIDDVDKALREMRRVCAPGATAIISVPNGHSYKYELRGPPPFNRHYFTMESFGERAKAAGFKVVRQVAIGRWVRLPRFISKSPMQLPMSSSDERHNVYFVHILEAA